MNWPTSGSGDFTALDRLTDEVIGAVRDHVVGGGAVAETTPTPRCDAETAGLFERPIYCDLPAGHDGPHQEGETMWTERPSPSTDRLPAIRHRLENSSHPDLLADMDLRWLLGEVDRLRAAVRVMDERIRRGGPSNWIDVADRYMPADVEASVRAALEGNR